MSRQQPSSRCVVRVAPDNCPEFQALCDSLQRNDPTVTTVTTDRSTPPEGYGRRLGEALWSNKNSVVSEIDLCLSFLLSGSDYCVGTTDSAKPLLKWIEQSSALRTVKLRGKTGANETPNEAELLLLKGIVNSMKKNPSIRGFHSFDANVPVALFSDYLSTPNSASMLQSLRIDVRSGTPSQLSKVAQAISALSSLENLALSCTLASLKLLPTASITSCLRELSVCFGGLPVAESDMSFYASILSNSNQLGRVTIEILEIFRTDWVEQIAPALRSNPTIVHLKLQRCLITPEARPFFIEQMSDSMDSQQHVRTLEFSGYEIECFAVLGGRRQARQARRPLKPQGHERLAEMICGSLLQHITLDFSMLTCAIGARTLLQNFRPVVTEMECIGGAIDFNALEGTSTPTHGAVSVDKCTFTALYVYVCARIR